MRNSAEIRKQFLQFFLSKNHTIVPSSSIVVKNDPTLMFTNAGMNQFKDWFLGNEAAKYSRVADTQKCLRVSGKHNDLEEVGIDTYHHTMFEMLGNWSFGDYFKKEAIEWAWELLTKTYEIPADRLYVTVFGGDKKEKLDQDEEAIEHWKNHISPDRILPFGKKDNFWEMGDTGPCGPCSEIHVDTRGDEERKKVDGRSLVNADHPQVIEIWNLVFIQFNRLANGTLETLPAKHVDTGMGLERLVRVLQHKHSNYDTDLFQPYIKFIEKISGIKYGGSTAETGATVPRSVGEGQGAEQTDIAMRVISDHIRAIGFTIADGQLPSNTGAGYVVRRILRRAVRYYYSFLGLKEPTLHKLIPILAENFAEVFPEIESQQKFVEKVVEEEEKNFLRTLEAGLKKLQQYNNEIIPGTVAFELYDTYGFPLDLTKLIAAEKGFTIDEAGFNEEMQKQKQRSRKATAVESGDWIVVNEINKTEFIGYDELESVSQIVKYRTQKAKDKTIFQIVLDKTPFYAESGGQVGDKGTLQIDDELIRVLDTKKENELIIHFVDKLPKNPDAPVIAKVDVRLRRNTMNNHTATHLLHAALRKVLGNHVQQKGSLVAPDYLRFDFSHFSKVSDEELLKIEQIVNEKIREDIDRNVQLLPLQEALQTGAMALFGEKYGDYVRVVTFDEKYSRELCGGTHVAATGAIGFFKITAETAVAAGVRRIEAVTGENAEHLIYEAFDRLHHLGKIVGQSKEIEKTVEQLLHENSALKKQVESYEAEKLQQLKKDLKNYIHTVNGTNILIEKLNISSADELKKLAYELKQEVDHLIFAAGISSNGKAYLCLLIDDDLVKEKNLDASKIIREAATKINGGGGGQKFFATAGGTRTEGIQDALNWIKEKISV